MKPKSVGILLAVLGTLVAIGFAQSRTGARHYDPKSETTVRGTITKVREIAGKRGGRTGLHITVNTGAGDVEVHLGPSSYVTQKQFSFVQGDVVEVVGSKTVVRGGDVILARAITKDGNTLILRDPQGIPEWSRRGLGNN